MDEADVAKILDNIPIVSLGNRDRSEQIESVQRILGELGIASSINEPGSLDYPGGIEPTDQPLLFAIWNFVTRRYGGASPAERQGGDRI